MKRFERKLKQLTKRSWSVSMDYRIEKLNQVIRGWINYFRMGNMKQTIEPPSAERHAWWCERGYALAPTRFC
ncbi:MAG: group II intron maturase-specific domain-containing protein [Anaerovoracaceae bacterium]|nr:group II intron maturase-specific domain-containing protein [Anaerovoracaceae bacterium]